MSAVTRLKLSAMLLVLSAIYAVLISENTEVANAVAGGYIFIVLSTITVATFWRKP